MEWAIIENELGFYLKEIRTPNDVGDSKFMIYNELSKIIMGTSAIRWI